MRETPLPWILSTIGAALISMAARADVYADVAQVIDPTGKALTAAQVKSWLPAYVTERPSSFPYNAVDAARAEKNHVETLFRARNHRAPNPQELIDGITRNLGQRWADPLSPLTLAALSRRAIITVNDYYLRHLGHLASPSDSIYWAFRVAYSGLKTVRYEIATSREAGKTPRLDRRNIPLGSQHYAADKPRKGYVFTCDPRIYQFPVVIGARVVGPWVGEKTWDATQKPYNEGVIQHSGGFFEFSVIEGVRNFLGNGLPPTGIPTGKAPVSRLDPAFFYDRNPNGFKEQTVSFSLPVNPVVEASPSCMRKEVGITVDGEAMTGPLDSTGRDEVAVEIQDDCGGTTQPGGLYHYHGQPHCLRRAHENQALVGYALDGFGIYNSYDENGVELTTDDLDVCHGRTAPIDWEGRRVNMYHYVITADYPYVLGCFRGKPKHDAFPPLPRI